MFSFFKNFFKPRLLNCYPICDGHKVILIAIYSNGAVFITDYRENKWRLCGAQVNFTFPTEG